MPAIGGFQTYDISLRDATNELTTHSIYTDEITSVSLPGFLTQLGAYNTALLGITNGVLAKNRWGETNIVSNAIPTDKSAQRESKLLVQYQGVTTEKPYTLTIGTVDFSVLNFIPGGGDAIIFEGAGASAAIVAWVTAFENLASAPDDEAENVVVVGMRFVGRNS